MNMQDWIIYICNQRAIQLEALIQDYLKLNPDLTKDDIVLRYYRSTGMTHVDRKNTDE